MVPGGKPVIALPEATPTSPDTLVAPVLVTVEPARTEKLAAAPSDGEVPASGPGDNTPKIRPANKIDIDRMIVIVRYFSLCILFVLLQKTSNQGIE